MLELHTKTDLQKSLHELREGKIGFVPTMGALHDGHLSLIDIAKQYADKIVVSIFVNPAQFAPGEDFDTYPRQTEADLAKLEQHNVDIVYLPSKEEIYPEGFDRQISVGAIGQELEGITRPHFFDGVATVVTELFDQVKPDMAVFGEKDFQQLHVIKQLDSGVEIIGAPIIREENGLAMSSRNMKLSPKAYKIAANLYAVLQAIQQQIIDGGSIAEVIEWGKKELINKGFDKVDYVELRDSDTLNKISTINNPARLLAAVFLEDIRLIDNIEILP